MKKLSLLFAIIALVAAACGGGDDDSAALPVNDGADPAIGSACLAGEPDCNDTPGGEPTDLPPAGDDSSVDGLVAQVSIADAASTSGDIAVAGFLVVVDGQARLCEALAESFPPQCGGASVALSDYDQVDPDDLQSEGAVTWTDYAVTVFGEMVDGTLVATPIE